MKLPFSASLRAGDHNVGSWPVGALRTRSAPCSGLTSPYDLCTCFGDYVIGGRRFPRVVYHFSIRHVVPVLLALTQRFYN